MAFYRNSAAGARMIRLVGRSYKLVEPGETAEIERHLVASLPAGVALVSEDGDAVEVPAIPADVAAMAGGETIIPTVEEVLSAEVVGDDDDEARASADLQAVAIQGSAAETVSAADKLRKIQADKAAYRASPPELSMSLTKKKLLTIARREKVDVETDDNKTDLIRKIEAARK